LFHNFYLLIIVPHKVTHQLELRAPWRWPTVQAETCRCNN